MKKIRIISIVVCLLGVMLVVNVAHAELFNRGTDSLGYQLIYDSDLNITWYDYSEPKNDWEVQMSWASALTVNFGGTVYDDWRLPIEMYGQDCRGYNCTNSEMGHLFYIGLNNIVSASQINTGPFENLHLYQEGYWSGTESGPSNPNVAFYFLFASGF